MRRSDRCHHPRGIFVLFYELDSLNVILASGAVFVLIKEIAGTKFFTSPNARTTMRALSVNTFGIYLIHVMFMEVLIDWNPFLPFDSFVGNAVWSVSVASIVVFLLSFLIVRFIRRIPLIKNIVP